MALIKCPKCGQTVLSVASVCPKCSHLLLQNPMSESEDGQVVECRRCGKLVARSTAECKFCGYPRQFRRRLRLAIWSAAGIGALVLAAWGLWALTAQRGTTTPPAPSLGEPSPPPSATPESVVRPLPQPTVESLPSAPLMEAELRPAQLPAAQTPQLPPTQTRWATTWANLRGAPRVPSAVIRVLQPGERVEVAMLRLGWWSVFVDGERVGFVANSVLTDQGGEP
jgi:ribosomal protein L37E